MIEFANYDNNKLIDFYIKNGLELKPIYAISKVDEFYLKNGFVYDNTDLISEECKTCEEYNITCFPKVVAYK